MGRGAGDGPARGGGRVHALHIAGEGQEHRHGAARDRRGDQGAQQAEEERDAGLGGHHAADDLSDHGASLSDKNTEGGSVLDRCGLYRSCSASSASPT